MVGVKEGERDAERKKREEKHMDIFALGLEYTRQYSWVAGTDLIKHFLSELFAADILLTLHAKAEQTAKVDTWHLIARSNNACL
jgi:hypothetical protein